MKLNNNVLLVIGLFICLLMGCFLWYAQTKPNIDRVDTVFQTRVDTIKDIKDTTIYKTVPKYIEKIKTDTLYTKDGKDTILAVENKVYQDTLTCAKDSIILQSFITGVNSTRDSIKANWKRQETIITNTIEITKYVTPKKTFFSHFKVGVGVGYGYGFKNKDIEPFVGISVNYNF